VTSSWSFILQLFFNVIGDHVDVWCVSSAAHVSRTIHRSHNILGIRVTVT